MGGTQLIARILVAASVTAVAALAPGAAQASWKISGTQSVGVMAWLAVDGSDNVYATLPNQRELVKVNFEHHTLAHWSFEGGPDGIGVDAAGHVVVNELPPFARITVFGPSGTPLHTWSTDGLGINQLAVDGPGHIFADGTSMFEFGPLGHVLQQWNSQGFGGLTVAPSGNLYVDDDTGHRIREYSKSGFLIRSWHADSPEGIAADTSGNLFVNEFLSDRVDEFSKTGTLLASFPVPNEQYGFAVAVDKHENVYLNPNGVLQRWHLVRPTTSFTAGPGSGAVITDHAVTFKFKASESTATFRCRLDGGAWKSCHSPHTTGQLSDGSHTFEVRATDAEGYTDETPASRTFTVATPPPHQPSG